MNPILNIAMKEVYVQIKTKRFAIMVALFVLLSLSFAYMIKNIVLGNPEVGEMYRQLYAGTSPFQMMFVSSFSGALSNLLPFLGGLLGYDLINREIEQGTIKITLSKPVYRDQFLLGKFFGSALTITVGVLIFYSLTLAFSLLFGVTITGKDLAMLFATLPFSIIYALIFLVFGMLFSVIIKKPSTALLVAIIFIFFLQFLYPMIVSIVTMFMYRDELFQAALISNQTTMYSPAWEKYVHTLRTLMYIVPSSHYGSIVGSIFGQKIEIMNFQFFGGSMFEDRTILESLSLVWQNIVALIVILLLPFAVAYAKFMNKDLR
ncbi:MULTISPECIES: ABC transporter permease subunit [unclassified Thermococcus]|uniref:ABC transporter permease subunit n=1 Tax=unclassified Thermococcus TaxID=2627626 RepID=UPI00143CA006|nr:MULTISPECIES: ABC transporter permease subunit [unclassified Thermococcus]